MSEAVFKIVGDEGLQYCLYARTPDTDEPWRLMGVYGGLDTAKTALAALLGKETFYYDVDGNLLMEKMPEASWGGVVNGLRARQHLSQVRASDL